MILIIVFLAFIISWAWIEITFIIFKRNVIENTSHIYENKIIWLLRLLGIILLLGSVLYIYIFENIKFQETINYCFGIIK